MSTQRWQIYCITEGTWTYGNVVGETAPTTCFTDAGHTVNPNSPRVFTTYTTNFTNNINLTKDPNNSDTGQLLLEGCINIKEHATPTTPDTSRHCIFVDTVDSQLKTLNSSGTVTKIQPMTTKGDLIAFDGTTTRLPVGTNGQTLFADSAESSGLRWGSTLVGIVTDVKSSGNNGGTFTSGAWQTRDLNTLTGNANNRIGVASNQITLQAGKYLIEASAPAFSVGYHRVRIRNITDSTTAQLGTNAYTFTNSNRSDNRSFVSAYIDISSAKVFELQHKCTRTDANEGFGRAMAVSSDDDTPLDEVYSTVKISVLE